MVMSNVSSTSKGQGAAQAKPGRRQSKPGILPAVIAGIGGTATVLAVVAVIMAANTAPQSSPAVATMQSPVATIQSSPTASYRPDRCEIPTLALLFKGTGVVHIHSGSYLSPPIRLTSEFQRVTFPPPGPSQAGEGSITVDGFTGNFGFGRIENEPAGTMLQGRAGEPERSYPLGNGTYLISIGWNPRKAC
jgi:hypothetical protein